jgi:hypothetical protein
MLGRTEEASDAEERSHPAIGPQSVKKKVKRRQKRKTHRTDTCVALPFRPISVSNPLRQSDGLETDRTTFGAREHESARVVQQVELLDALERSNRLEADAARLSRHFRRDGAAVAKPSVGTFITPRLVLAMSR